MTAIVWDAVGERLFETGVDRGVLYLPDENGVYGGGVAWNGLISVTATPTGGEATAQYADNIKYLNMVSDEEFGGTIEAFTYPDEFMLCDGSAMPSEGVILGQQGRSQFGFSFRTKIGNDVAGSDLGYKLHLVYGALAAPSEKSYQTVNDSPEAMTFSWEITTTPVPVTGHKHTAHLEIDSTKVDKTKLAALEAILYGEETDAMLPLPDVVLSMFSE